MKVLPDTLMQKIAAEMNHSETAFIQELDETNNLTKGGTSMNSVNDKQDKFVFQHSKKVH